MKPKELLIEIKANMEHEQTEYSKGMYDGACAIYTAYRADARKRSAKHREKNPNYYSDWRNKNRESYNEYQREYKRRMRKLGKTEQAIISDINNMEGGIDKSV